MISKFIRAYRAKQLRQIYDKFKKSAVIGDHFETSLTAEILNEGEIKENIIVGHHTRILGTLICKKKAKISIGNYSVIQNGSSIQCLENIEIGHFVGIAQGTIVVDNNNHSTDPVEWVKHRIRVAPGGSGYPGLGNGWELSESAPIKIGNAVWIGAFCTITKGVTIGEGSIVARCSVVTKNVPAYSVVAGNPAKIVAQREKPKFPYYSIE